MWEAFESWDLGFTSRMLFVVLFSDTTADLYHVVIQLMFVYASAYDLQSNLC